jgi:hypothetical protein
VSSRTIGRLRGLSLVAALTTAVVTSVTVPASAASTTTAPSTQVARWGAGYLADQLAAGGGHLDSFGFPDPGNTAYAVIGLHAAGVGQSASAQAIAYLKTQLTDALRYDDGTDDPGRVGYYILAAVSAGQDPYRFGGTAAENDLVARLLATARPAGTDAGLFGTGDPAYDGAFRQGIALAALDAAGVPASDARVIKAAAWLVRQQCGNGLWLGYRADTTTACPAADPNTFAGPDTNSSSAAVQGLASYRLFPRRSATLDSLRTIQSADGGFPYLAAPGQASDPNSTALVIQALLSTGVAATAWTKGSATPLSALASYQLGCQDAAADRGAFFYPGSRSVNVLATVQAVPAAAGLALSAVQPRSVSSAVPHPSCDPSPATALAPAAARPATVALALAGTAGPCPGTTGVTVSVDFTAFGQGVQTRCAPGTPATGVAALQEAGFTPTGTSQYGLAFVCRINNLPSSTQQSCTRTPPATAYWAYYHANSGATTWTYSTQSASTYQPVQGSIEAWAFGNSAQPSKTPTQIRTGQ